MDDRDIPLGLGCSILLSHSGADKDFVRFLNEALSHSGYRVFYDEQSLPKAVPLSMSNILAELKDVKLAVLVLSDAFFTRTKHPMTELTTILAAGIQMLPVFYGFSVDEFKTKCRNQEWLTTWKGWVDEEVISEDTIGEWEAALQDVSYTNGLEYCKEATNTLELRNKIVASVCHILKPDLRWSAEGVQGMDRLCQVVSESFAERLQQTCTNSVVGMENESVSKQPMVGGMYGIAGIGKSTLCKALCDFFFKEFNGRVCYIELGDHSEAAVRKRLESILNWLTGGSAPQQSLSDDQLWNLLRDHNQLLGSPPVFLAIDNVRAGASMDEAEKILGCGPFPSGSKIFVTSQSANVLKNLFCSWVQRFTHLSFAEAKKIFCHKIYSREHTTLSHEQGRVVDECVRTCTLNKSQSDYYPMMLIVLASYMRQTSQDPLQWQGKLEELKADGIFASTISTHIEKLESIFKFLYGSLTEVQQHMLLDLALYLPDALNQSCNVEDVRKFWLDNSYPYQDVNPILSQLVDLSLVEGRGMSAIHAYKCFHVHDLLREFVKKEGTRSKEGTKRCTRVFKEHQRVKPSWRPWVESRLMIKRLGISRCHFEGPTLDLSQIKKLRVLHLIHNEGLKHVRLRKTAWSSLQSLIVQTSTPIKISIVDVRNRPKKNRAFYVDVRNCDITSEARYLHKNPNSGLTWRNVVSLQLENVRMHGQLEICLGGLQQLHDLRLTDLPDLRTNLEFDRCPNVRRIRLINLPNLEAISGLEKSLNVEWLSVARCDSLRSLVLLDKLANYDIGSCKALESIELRQSHLENISDVVTNFSRLDVAYCPLTHVIGLSHRKFIGTVRSEFYTNERRLQCSPEILRQMHMFKFSEYRWQQEIRTATIVSIELQGNGLSELRMRDVQDTCSYILALAHTSASSLKSLEIWCSREGSCGCDHSLLRQPRFDCFKMALTRLSFECMSVRNLSSLENCSLMERLSLYGCLSAMKWPDFGKMTSLWTLTVLVPGSLAYWPSGLQSHPSLEELCIMGSNQIPPEQLLEIVTGMDPRWRSDRLCSFASLEVLVHDFYSSRKDNLCIAIALMANTEKLLYIIDQMLGDMEEENRRFFHLLSQLLYGLWVEADCTLHECTPACAEGTGQLLQDCMKGLLSSKSMISALLLTIPEEESCYLWRENDDHINHRWLHAEDLYSDVVLNSCMRFRSRYAYESLVLVGCASIEKFEVALEELQEYGRVEAIVDSYFDRWREQEDSRLPLLLWDRVPEEYRRPRDMFPAKGGWPNEMVIEHDLAAVRVADAVCRLLGHLTLTLVSQSFEGADMLAQAVKKMYGTYYSRAAFAPNYTQSINTDRKKWHHPVGCSCAALLHPVGWKYAINWFDGELDFSALGMDTYRLIRPLIRRKCKCEHWLSDNSLPCI